MMGVAVNTSKTVLWSIFVLSACLLLVVADPQVSSDHSKEDTDLVFDNLDHRIERQISNSELRNSSPLVEDEEEHWISRTLGRIKRSIGDIFSKNEETHTKHKKEEKSHLRPAVANDFHHQQKHNEVHHKNNGNDSHQSHDSLQEHIHKKKYNKKKLLRKHRQIGQQEADDYDEDDEYYQEGENGDEYDTNDGQAASSNQTPVGVNDDEDLGDLSGDGSGEVELPVTPRITHDLAAAYPRYYRFTFTILEPYTDEFQDRNSNQFQGFSSRIKREVEELFNEVPGEQHAAVISIQKYESDPFKVSVTVDVDSRDYYDAETIKNTVYHQIKDNHRLKELTASPDNFYFRAFEAQVSNCDVTQLPCRNGQCVPVEKRCDGIYDCSDSSDEEGCVIETTTSPPIPTTTTTTTTTTTQAPTTTSSTAAPVFVPEETESPFEGSGEVETTCRADDTVGCPDGSRNICADQYCDGIKDCADGSDEDNCPPRLRPEARPFECGQGEFGCDVTRCIPVAKRCDGVSDCEDQTDEQECPKCQPGEHQCDRDVCISRERVCDRAPDCRDGSDERDCQVSQCPSGQFNCGAGQCVPSHVRCDGRDDCFNRLDELNCTRPSVYNCREGEFRCVDGLCLDARRRCDGYPDCPDNSDEAGCSGPTPRPSISSHYPNASVCDDDQIQCGDGSCINKDFKCDGFPDCRDNSDESDCLKCSDTEFECEVDSRCIPDSLMCNGRNDCSDGADEEDCPQPSPACNANEFKCHNGQCIPNYLTCDTRPDCSDASDELDCPCRSDQFQCLNGQCVAGNLRCNRRYDCSDGSDELNCPTTSPPYVPIEPTTTSRPPTFSCPLGYEPCQTGNQCILSSQICDGHVDCNDLSDEDCPDSNRLLLRTYPDQQQIKENFYKLDREVVFQCRDEGPLRAKVHWIRPNGQPLPPGAVDRNGRLEIPDIKVEHAGTYICAATGYPDRMPGAQISVQLHVERWEPPPIRPPTACPLDQATCSNGECIPKSSICNGAYDCTDGSDESRCGKGGVGGLGCEPNEYQCANRKCVLKTWRCDSDNDCGDNSDEINCGTTPPGSLCSVHQFSCRSGNQCIPKSYHCDTERDCVDGSDEIGCAQPVISKPPPPMITVSRGSTFELTCTAVGIPVPEIIWRLNWGHVPQKCVSTSENGYGKLICDNAQVEDQGAYSCEAINIKGTKFAVPDTILVVKTESVCQAGYFNTEARTEVECIKCFCFGQSTDCRSADLFIYQFQPPFDTLKILGVRVDPYTGVVDIRDEPIYKGAQPQLLSRGRNGVYSVSTGELVQPSVLPYFALPENYHHNQLKSYGGYLRYSVYQSNRGRQTPGPDVIITGNNYTLLHTSRNSPTPNRIEDMEVRFFEGEWQIKSDRQPEHIATREEIMMALEDVDNILIKLLYFEGNLNTTLENIEMDSAATPNSGLGAASYVEQCSCPAGYSGTSCESCAEGYVRHESGPWLGQCYREPTRCPPGTYNDGRECQVCPCPLTNPSNQFARTCHLGAGGNVVCDCPPGYVGNRCEQCAPGYAGNPLVPGDSCRPESYCSIDGSSGSDVDGRCHCKTNTMGPTCNQCKPNTFHLSSKNQFGCIDCFCMGVTKQCSSSNWYRDTISTVFTSSVSDFKLIEDLNKNVPITEGIRLNQDSREIVYSGFSSASVYYWALPTRYLGDKVTSYGGYLRYTLRHTPVPGGASSRNSAPDVELVSANNINLLFFSRNQSQPTNTPQTYVVPLLEQYWQRNDGQAADREHLLMALADVSAIYIKATYYTNTREAALISVSLDIANERNTGSLQRALEVEQCHCPVGYVGLSCEDCDIGYSRSGDGLYLELCQPCNCNGYSNECDAESGVCFNCKDHTTGENCEQCLPGYSGDPANGVPCRYQGPVTCTCDPRGSVSTECVNDRCTCKVNVEGNNCDRCRQGTFGLNASNIDGCEFCFCSGVANECSESNLYLEQIPVQIIDAHGFSLTDQYHRVRYSDGFVTNIAVDEIGYNFLPSQRERLFWSLPSIATGNKIKSYGGKLDFTQRYTQRPYGRFEPDQDVIITGNGVTIYWSNPEPLREEIANSVSVKLHPSARWFRIDSGKGPKPASREDILIVLANIDSILIRATQSSDTSSAYLSDISLDTAVEVYTGQPRASNVEVCRCPPGYRGTSCEACTSGYYRDFYFELTKPLGSCTRCPCNGREESCYQDASRAVVCNCLPGYTGRACEFTDAETTTPPPPQPAPNTTVGPPSITVEIKGPILRIYEAGSTVRFNCTATSRLRPDYVRVHWTKEGRDLPYHAIDDGRGILIITNLKVTDSGRYICEADDGYTIVTQSVEVVVGEQQLQRPTIAISSPYIEVTEGQLVEVSCAASGIPTPEFQLLRPDNRPLNPLHSFDNGVFRILQALKSDEGQYQCIAANSAGTDSATFEVRVLDSISIMKVEIQPSSFYGKAGETVVLHCIADQQTVRDFRWSKQNGELPYSSREDRNTLIISDARTEDSGVYVCTATSYSGTRGTQKATVSISGTDVVKYPTATVTPERVSISQGQSVELNCAATGVPAPSVKWTKLGGELGDNVQQIGAILYIRNARVDDRGVYVCVATNVHGLEQASAVVDITRLETPRLEIYPKASQVVIGGNSAILQCRAVAGIPSPTIAWTRPNGQPLGRNVEEMSGGTLRFTQITQNEGGEYVCTAANEAGTATATATIIVHTYPELFITPQEGLIVKNEGDFLRMECHGSGNPVPTVIWRKEDGIERFSGRPDLLQQSVAFQEFTRLTKQDSGLYICTATSSAGVTEKRVQLVVDSLPSRGDNPGGDSGSNPVPDYPGGYPGRDVTEFVAPVGTQAQLRCSIKDAQQQSLYIQWVRADNRSLPEGASIRSGTLFIDNVQPGAAGEYHCVGLSSSGRPAFRVSAHLRVVSPPRLSLEPMTQVVHPGDTAYIICKAVGEQPIDIRWYPVDRQMPPTVHSRDGYIRFESIQVDDAGRYRCKANNSAGEADSVAEVIVEPNYTNKPTLTAENRYQEAHVGSQVSLRCKAGNQNIRNNIRWLREGAPLPEHARVTQETLVIYELKPEDQGRYYCEVSNEAGTASDFIDLAVTGPSVKSISSRLHITPPEQDYRVGENIDLNCQSDERGVIPTWSKVGGYLADNVRGSAGRLMINNLRPDNAGVYRCEATGRQGVYQRNYTLNVIGDSYQEEKPVEIKTAPRGFSVVLDCNTNLDEPVTYYWTKQGGSLPKYVDVYSKSIQLNEVGSMEAGTYICSATHGSQTVDKPIILVVTGIVPYFTQAPNSYITLPALQDSYIEFNLEISFKPENEHGLILYNGNKGHDENGDFISLALNNGVPEFKFNLGQGTTTVRSNKSVSSREWHTVKIIRNRKKVTMYVDGEGPYIGETGGKLVGLDLQEPMFLGGVPDYYSVSPNVNIYTGFVGCISRLKIGHAHQDILRDAFNKTGITTCETCAENKCQNQGACQEALTKEGYICTCPAGFSGPTCNKLKGEACSPYSCGIGRCIDTPDSFQCQCPLGRTGKRCEREIMINEPAFRGDAFLAYERPKPTRRMKLTLKIKPSDVSDGVLLYCGETDEGHGDFVSLAIKDRHLEFRFDAGDGPVVVRSHQEIVPNQWSILTATRSLTGAKLAVNGEVPSTARLTNHKILNLQTPLYVGGYDKYNVRINDGVQVSSGFNGCISDISVSDLNINLIKNVTESANVEDCSISDNSDDDVDNNIYSPEYTQNRPNPASDESRRAACASQPCFNGGQCYPTSAIDYRCICLRGFTGARCEIQQSPCETRPCQNEGICRVNGTGYACDCPLGFTGNNCDIGVTLSTDAHFNGRGYLEFSRSLLNHENDDQEEVVALEFSTNSSEGLIFWHGQRPNENGQGRDYISLGIINGYLEYSYDLGMGPALIQNSDIRVSDGQRHSVILKRLGTHGSMEVDHGPVVEGQAQGFTTTMNTDGNIYLGGTPNNSLMTGSRFPQSFEGCIHQFELQESKSLDLGVKAISGLNVKPCSRNAFDTFSNNIWNDLVN